MQSTIIASKAWTRSLIRESGKLLADTVARSSRAASKQNRYLSAVVLLTVRGLEVVERQPLFYSWFRLTGPSWA